MQKEEIDNKVMEFVVDGLMPLSIVEKSCFKDMLQALNSQYNPPCSKTLKKKIELDFEEMKKAMMDEIQQVDALAITHDSWTSVATDNYETVTVQYIHEEEGKWILKSRVLKTERIEGSHSAEAIADFMKGVKDRWKIKKITAVSDNASVEVKCFQKVLKWDWIGCIGHLINLLVRDVLKGNERVKAIVAKGRQLVSYFKKSPLATHHFREKQEALLPDGKRHELCNDVATRWNSTVDMLVRLLEQSSPLHAVANDPNLRIKNLKPFLFNAHDQVIVEEVIRILEPFKNMSEKLSASRIPTLSLVLPSITKLKLVLEKKDLPEDEEDEETLQCYILIEEIKKNISSVIDTRLKSSAMHETASILDPVTKGFMVTNFSEEYVTIKLLNLLTESCRSDNSATSSADAEEISEPADKKQKTEGTPSTDYGWLEDVLVKNTPVQQPNASQARLRQEIELYLQDGDDAIDVGAMQWWSKKAALYPNIAKLAKTVLCIPASSVESERIWSLAGNIITKKRASLLPENLDMLLFLNHNRKRNDSKM